MENNCIYNLDKNIVYEENKALFFLYNTLIGRLLLKLLITKPISMIVGFYMDSKLSTIHIKRFIKKNSIDISEYEKIKYSSFNNFFTRRLLPDKRLINYNDNLLISPADSKVMAYDINENTSFKIKNSIYTVSEILNDDTLAHDYQEGIAIVFRLGVDDYHRYIFIDDGILLKTKNISGKFHTVNPIAFKKYKVFSENHRVWSQLKTKNFGDIIVVEVGALLVGKIRNNDITHFKRGDEKGYFCFGGSTIVILFKKDTIVLDSIIKNNSKQNIETRVLQGMVIGKKVKNDS